MTDHDVFLSYSHADRKAATVLRAQLEQRSLNVFRDVESLRAGDLWLNQLQNAVDACHSFVVLVGRDGVRRWVGAETQAALSRYFGPHDDTARLPIFPILLGDTDPASLPAFLRLFQGTPWDGTETLPDSLLDQIAKQTIAPNDALAFEDCPFVGLDAFRPDQAQLFFGRQKETLDALACFDTRPGSPTVRWLEINGNSGAGKSSLMNAGLLPLVDQGWLWPRTGYESWRRIGPMMPGQRPLEKLAQTLANAFGCEMAVVHELLTKNEHGLRMWLRSRVQNQTAFLLAIDQLEELFTFADPAERGAFDRALAAALEDVECPLFVISTVRTDFLDRFDQLLPRLVPVRNRSGRLWTLPLITGDALREIISGPARLARLDVSEVQTAILQEARDEPGALPLIENALQWLWQQRTDARLSGRLLEQQGGIAGILSRNADQLLHGLGERRDQALELLLRLVKVDPEGRRHTRQRLPFGEAVAVAGGGTSGQDLIYRLAGAHDRDLRPNRGPVRLITVTGDAKGETTADDGDRSVNLIHETLIRSKGADAEGKPIPLWPTLWHYLEQHRAQAVLRDRARLLPLEIEDAAATWDAANRVERERWHEDRFQEVIRESRRSGVAIGDIVRPGLCRAFFGPFEQDEIYQLLALGADADETAGSGRYGDPWRLPLSHQARATLGDRLALLGDRRDGVGLRQDRLPDIAWHRIDGGEVTIESKPPITRIVKPFSMARYPVTIDQFQAFVSDGFRDGRWQPPPGFPEKRLETGPPTHRGRHGNHPADSVDWHDAMAFCHWLSARLGAEVRLPTEFEWQLAATGGDPANTYPWGPAWHPEQEPWRANTYESGLGRSTAVGLCPLGASKAGVQDMAGTVLEWCLNKSDKPDATESRSDDTDSRVVRGGSWRDDRDIARCAVRDWADPDPRFDRLGFRVVSSSPILDH